MKRYVIDVLIPAHNESAIIDKTIQSIAVQNIDRDWQFTIHVLANGCTDSTAEVAEQTIATLPNIPQMTFKIHNLKDANKIKSLNYGLKCSDSPFVFCIDADAILTPNCFAATINLFKEPEVIVAGPMSQLLIGRKQRKGLLGQIQKTANICGRFYECTTPAGCMIAHRRELFDQYPTTIAADDTWTNFFAASKFGWDAVRVAKDAKVYVVGPQQWLDYFKQESRFVRGTAQLLEEFPEFIPVRKEQIITIRKLAQKNLAKVKKQLKRDHLKVATIKQRELVQSICAENADFMAEQLIKDGQWERIYTTKQAPPTGLDS